MAALSSSIRRWTVWFLLATVFAVACWFLSQWQLARLNEVKGVISRINQNYDAQPAELAQLLTSSAKFDAQNEYRPVEVSGGYQWMNTALVRNRPLNGQPGFEVFAPFELTNGKIVFVDRGWLATGTNQDLPDRIVLPPKVQVSLIGRIKQSAADSGRNYDKQAQLQLGAPSAIEAARALNLPAASFYDDFYLILDSESAGDGSTLMRDAALKPLLRPEYTEGNHLSYAMQWILFALMAFFAIGWAIRQELLHRKAALDPTFVVKKRRAVGSIDAEVEDALVDSSSPK